MFYAHPDVLDNVASAPVAGAVYCSAVSYRENDVLFVLAAGVHA